MNDGLPGPDLIVCLLGLMGSSAWRLRRDDGVERMEVWVGSGEVVRLRSWIWLEVREQEMRRRRARRWRRLGRLMRV